MYKIYKGPVHRNHGNIYIACPVKTRVCTTSPLGTARISTRPATKSVDSGRVGCPGMVFDYRYNFSGAHVLTDQRRQGWGTNLVRRCGTNQPQWWRWFLFFHKEISVTITYLFRRSLTIINIVEGLEGIPGVINNHGTSQPIAILIREVTMVPISS